MMEANEWLEMVNLHLKWKERLASYVAGTSQETFIPGVVASDKKCILGRWLNSHAEEYNGSTLYLSVRLAHAELHLSAGKIILLSDQGKKEDAKKILTRDFAKLSNQFKLDLIRLRGID